VKFDSDAWTEEIAKNEIRLNKIFFNCIFHYNNIFKILFFFKI
jgi:hypothetical protein